MRGDVAGGVDMAGISGTIEIVSFEPYEWKGPRKMRKGDILQLILPPVAEGNVTQPALNMRVGENKDKTGVAEFMEEIKPDALDFWQNLKRERMMAEKIFERMGGLPS